MHHIIIQFAADKTLAPRASLLKSWAEFTLSFPRKRESIQRPTPASGEGESLNAGEVTIRIVGKEEMTELNATYRHKQGTTNVLSFPFSMTENVDIGMPILGDIVICAEVVNEEALAALPEDASAAQSKQQREAHWAHMIVHGIFHLYGYDHETEAQADIMEPLEIEVMRALGFANPYATGEKIKHHE